ncbi:hypothetical protein, partial [Yersinia kristensenii]|uniref:hypothetical protein n=1 Tax=Yersinia kristensenii TaxID=28152 RepID=UPI001C1284B7
NTPLARKHYPILWATKSAHWIIITPNIWTIRHFMEENIFKIILVKYDIYYSLSNTFLFMNDFITTTHC